MKKWNKKPLPPCGRSTCINSRESSRSPFAHVCIALSDNDFRREDGTPYPCPFYKPKNGGVENGN